jgi:poly(A) polymerase
MEKEPVLHLNPFTASTSETQLFAPPPSDTACHHKIYKFTMPEEMLDFDAAKVVKRLSRFGYDAYLVGGSVRDTLFGVKPKDFDVATSALPTEIRRLFRNCRLIGRRFRLAHLIFRGNKIIEVATFRRNPTSEDDISGRHAAENLFGGPADDAIRRDFTINALMYDVGRREIHDYVGGIEDIEARVLRTIGDPNRRFLEDPVRIIRAVKFAERLTLAIAPEMLEAARAHAHLVRECAPARLVEELYKVLRTGRAAACFRQLHELGVLKGLMPHFDACLDEADPVSVWETLDKADDATRRLGVLSDVTTLSALLYPFAKDILTEKGDTAAKIQKRVQELLFPMTFPKRCIAMVRQILTAERKLSIGPKTAKIRRILDRDYALDAIDFMGIIAKDDAEAARHAEWLKLAKRRRITRGGEKCEFQKRKRRRPRRRPRTAPAASEDQMVEHTV